MKMPIVIKKIALQGYAALLCEEIGHRLEVTAAAIVHDFFETAEGPAPPTEAVNRNLKHRLTDT